MLTTSSVSVSSFVRFDAASMPVSRMLIRASSVSGVLIGEACVLGFGIDRRAGARARVPGCRPATLANEDPRRGVIHGPRRIAHRAVHQDHAEREGREGRATVGRWRSGACTSPIDIASAIASSRQAASRPIRMSDGQRGRRGHEQRRELADAADGLQQQDQRDADDGQREEGGGAVAPRIPLPETRPQEGQESGGIWGAPAPSRRGDGRRAQVGRKSSTVLRRVRYAPRRGRRSRLPDY